LQAYLLTPVDPVWRYVSAHVAERLARLPFSAVIVVGFFIFYAPARFSPDLWNVSLAFVFCIFAFVLRFLLQYTLGLSVFWTERATAVEMLMFVVYMFLSGAVAPLDMFPAAARELVMWTPFPYLIWVPARLIVGGGAVDVPRALLVCVSWMLLLWVVNRVVWRAALKRNGAMGG
jgi:ABC-2 type transport system permease protein